MSVWEYLDKHEIIGTFVVLVMGYLVLVVIESVLVSWAKAWGSRGRAARNEGGAQDG